ncbi:predicted protein [Arabidopsis lyrata subsp. lyrata]|uniref:Predicted protein n=1 Tax=Arabidopsis lyrata subsp. lyrata TaxID=81972 RepID=D7LPS1_ARALL|nr:predicted protein [Arabidopsis lyrata subsp. lyrata]
MSPKFILALSKDKMSRYSEQVDAYRAACGHHPELKSFDSALQQRTKKMIDSLTVEAKTGSVSPHTVHKEFKAMGNPFDGSELTNQFELMNKQQESLLKKVTERISTVKTVTIISHVVFGAVGVIYFAGCIGLMCTGVGAPLGAVGAMVGIIVLPLGWVGVNYFLNERLEALQKQLKALNIVKSIPPKIGEGTITDQVGINSVSEQVDELKDQIKSMLEAVDDAIESKGDEVDMKGDMQSLVEEVEKLTTKIKEIGDDVDVYSKLIKETRLHVLEKINGSGK